MQRRAASACPLYDRSDSDEVLDKKNAVDFVDFAGILVDGKTAEAWKKLSRYANGGPITYREIRGLEQIVCIIAARLGFSSGKL